MKRTPLKRKTPLRRRRRAKPERMAPLVPADEMAGWIERGMPMGSLTGVTFYRNDQLPGPPSPSRPARRRTKYSRRPRDLAFMAFVKRQPCCMVQMESWRRSLHPGGMTGVRLLGLWKGPLAFTGCRGVIEAHHAGARGTGQKAPDNTCIPLCEAHHRGDDIGITRYRGPFAGWPRGAVKQWELAMVELYQRAYAEHLAGQSAGLF